MLTARDIMSRDIITVTEESTIKELARILTSNHISGVPVINDSGKLVGVVTESDLIFQTKKVHIPTVITILDSVFYLENPDKMGDEMKKMAGSKVKDILTSSPVTVTEETPLDEIATIMSEKNFHTLPVVNKETLVGVIGKKDIIRTLIN
ncbi:MAG: CBS domain-containing protein [Proteobacteria bacterium]|jgi:CBS domain-containing protein|nr:CBS domain-containing protein [Desulfocapsa sp.]MBU3946399.1 CBS domain-containing protein [Pseudomonadota bacterium]MCG2743759.1 CBS domain-containing protein [Desulfobacteraceae bacterium]MDO8947231.1 CBS domain-containing protein [Desulfocapsaceae bacterium]MBU3983708.1 CBS domain-containing protein [Pseudomonadota bacterium]